jgi:glutaredoxin
VSFQRAIVIGLAVALLAFLSTRRSDVDRALAEPFTAAPGHEVVLYTTSWCGYCARARRFLEANGVAYTEIDVERSEAGRQEYERRGGYGVPMFLIDGRAIFGLDPEAVVEALTRPAE